MVVVHVIWPLRPSAVAMKMMLGTQKSDADMKLGLGDYE